MKPERGIVALLLIPLLFLGLDFSRHVPQERNVPAFFLEEAPGLQVALQGDWPGAGVYQNIDGLTLAGVIDLTGLVVAPHLIERMRNYPPLQPGESFIFQLDGETIVDFSHAWMPASQRVTLGIDLHPDRMTGRDWEYLPGVGPALAAGIELDRQNNGDFVRLEALQRVKGIGGKRIAEWKIFF